MTFYKPFRVHDVLTGEQLFRGMGLCAQQVYEDYRRHKGQCVGVSSKALDSSDRNERLAAFKALKLRDDWIDDDAIFMVAEEARR